VPQRIDEFADINQVLGVLTNGIRNREADSLVIDNISEFLPVPVIAIGDLKRGV